ncbi:fungal-specific transcription factor domain-containing protein [Cryomyces antarcticus]
MSRGATTNGSDEEAVIYHQSRMLQDPTGRLLYVGDSATLSYLQLIRMMVENVAGPSPFTTDPRRHRIMESQFTMPSNTRHTHLLPDKKTAYVLVDAFFINTHGLVHMFDRQSFLNSVRSCYVDPLSTDPTWLCHLNLVFAIGLMLATPRAGTTEAAIIEKLLKDDLDRAEIFYLNAKSLSDPLTGFEDAGFWSIQALFLMAVYMLTKSKRNAAFAAFGMAVRSAYSLGLHREETMVIFSLEEQEARRNLWRSMYIMDRFLSCSLGRPAAISKDDCSGDTLNPPDRSNEFSAYGFSSAYPQAASFEQTGPLALEAAVRSCSAIGMILRKVYQQRRISTKLAQEIADICKLWPRALAPMLHWRQASSATPSQGVAILHVNLLYCHSIVLLTRPFFLFLLNAEIQKNMTQPYGNRPTHNFIRMEKFSDACVIASTHTVVLVQNAFEAGYLPRRNPAVIYFLFAAALVLLSNEFAGLHTNTVGDQCIAKCIGIVTYCGETDPQAARLVFILSAFRDVAAKQKDVRKKQREVQTNTMSSVSLQMAMQAYSAHPEHHSIADPLPTHIEQRHQQPAMTTSPAIDFAEPHPNAPLSDEPAAQGTTNLPQPPPMPTKPEPPQQPAQMFSPSTATPQGPALPPYERHGSLSSLLDLSALDNRYQSAREEDSSGAEENVDFDALWAWPSMTPAVGTPGFSGDVQEISDSAVPLFGLQFAE